MGKVRPRTSSRSRWWGLAWPPRERYSTIQPSRVLFVRADSRIFAVGRNSTEAQASRSSEVELRKSSSVETPCAHLKTTKHFYIRSADRAERSHCACLRRLSARLVLQRGDDAAGSGNSPGVESRAASFTPNGAACRTQTAWKSLLWSLASMCARLDLERDIVRSDIGSIPSQSI